jgi:hypothetical protein
MIANLLHLVRLIATDHRGLNAKRHHKGLFFPRDRFIHIAKASHDPVFIIEFLTRVLVWHKITIIPFFFPKKKHFMLSSFSWKQAEGNSVAPTTIDLFPFQKLHLRHHTKDMYFSSPCTPQYHFLLNIFTHFSFIWELRHASI